MKLPYIPQPLPPDIDDVFTKSFLWKIGEANRALARLGELPALLPNSDLTDRLSAPLLKKEAVLSSKIEGTQTTLAELLKHEAHIEDINNKNENLDTKEVENYVKAMHTGMALVKEYSLSSRTLKEMHKALLTGVRNEQGIPGEFRNFQAYIGQRGTTIEKASFVPSPPERIEMLMSHLENYIHSGVKEDPLIKCAFIHYQFEAIHPFGDGNGRIGRLLIPLFFYHCGIIKIPLVYVSEYFEQHRTKYYSRLLGVSEEMNWEGWIDFFLDSIVSQSETTLKRGEKIIEMYNQFHEKKAIPVKSPYTLDLVQHIFRYPITAAPFFADRCNVVPKTARALLEKMVELKILKKTNGLYKKKHVKVYTFQKLLDVVNSES